MNEFFLHYNLLNDETSYMNYLYYNVPEPFTKHWHSDYELFVFLDGEGIMTMKTERIPLHAGSIVLIPPEIYHCYENLDNKTRSRIVINLPPRVIKSLGLNETFTKLTEFGSVFDISTSDELTALINSPLDKSQTTSDENMSVYCLGILLQLLSELATGKFSIIQKKNRQSEVTKKIIAYINENIDRTLKVDNIAKDLYLSKSYVANKFLSEMKIGVMHFVRNKKILYAKSLILSGESPTDVYVKCGFNDYATFFRAFKKITGLTPSELKPKK